jgi:hypothetical protein
MCFSPKLQYGHQNEFDAELKYVDKIAKRSYKKNYQHKMYILYVYVTVQPPMCKIFFNF